MTDLPTTDLLHLLGLTDASGQPTGEVAAYIISSLQAHHDDGVPVSVDWERLEPGDGMRGIDLLRAMETARVERAEEPTPARTADVVQAVIKGHIGGTDHYLMQFDPHAGRYQPLGGKIDPEDVDIEVALRRELFEELALTHPPTQEECLLIALPVVHKEQAISATYGVYTQYTMRFFHVVEWGLPLVPDDDTQWIPRQALIEGEAPDGRPIADVYRRVLGLEALDVLSRTQIV